jgi:hypothetical protein
MGASAAMPPAASAAMSPAMTPAMAGGSEPQPPATDDAATPSVACAPGDELPEAMAVQVGMGAAPSGPFPVTVELDPGLATHTIYRPETLGDVKHPIVVWENGGCLRDGTWFFFEFLMELASHGSIVIVSGPPGGSGMGELGVDGAALVAGIDWATAENDRPCSKFYRKLDTSEVAAMGQSCGGLHAYGAAKDPRVTVVGIWNSGLLEEEQKPTLETLHSPIGFFIGGSGDVAYPNAEDDFERLMGEIPVWYGNLDVGHGATYQQDNGGEFGRVGVAFLKWQLFNDDGPEGKGMFVGADCGLCNTDWVIKKKNLD